MTAAQGQTLLNLDEIKIDPAWALRVPASLALRRRVLAFACIDGRLFVACHDPNDSAALEAVRRFTGQPVEVFPAERESLMRALQKVYAHGAGSPRKSSVILPNFGAELLEGSDPVALCQEILHAAWLRKASDIHVEPTKADVRIRFRVDGVLEEYARLGLPMLSGLLSRFKVMSGMDIAEKRAPQDGSFSYSPSGEPSAMGINVRSASLPTRYGERMTLRLLMSNAAGLGLENLGLSKVDSARFESVLDQPNGLVLITGPTGSGKTTTMYATLRRLMQKAELNILTIEDPIEYELEGVSQVEVDEADKVSFQKALRSVLRHDPDVLMIGEIRDAETLDVAVKSALTGHLVLSTLHTNGAVSAVTRLCDMGLPRYLIAATLRLCIAQRLVRRLCKRCATAAAVGAAAAGALGHPDEGAKEILAPKGCLYCAGRGFAGRLGIFEMLSVDERIGRTICDSATEDDLLRGLQAGGWTSLREDAWQKVVAGETAVSEALDAVSRF